MQIVRVVVLFAWMFFPLCALGFSQAEAPISRAEFTATLARIEKSHDALEKQSDDNRTEIARLKAQSEVWATILSVVSGGTAVVSGVNATLHKKNAAAAQSRTTRK